MKAHQPDIERYTNVDNIITNYQKAADAFISQLLAKSFSHTSCEALKDFTKRIDIESSELIVALFRMLQIVTLTYESLKKNKQYDDISILTRRFEMTTTALFALEERQKQSKKKLSFKMIREMTALTDACITLLQKK